MPRPSGRTNSQMREVTIETNINAYAEGSCLISFGNTKVHCTATVQDTIPRWMRGEGKGWVTAEYGMLPRSTHSRIDREATRGKQTGRTVEISRLIGRSIRAVVDMQALGERTIWLDCDVLQADGGTRTASITGAFVALQLAIQKLISDGSLEKNPIREYLAAISCGVTEIGEVIDLDYDEDSCAIADSNFILTESGGLVEIQATAEDKPISKDSFQGLLSLAEEGVSDLIALQKKAIGESS